MGDPPAAELNGVDSELLSAIAEQRDPEALAALYDHYAGQAYGLSLKIVNDAGIAEDVVQEAFFSVWRNAGGYERRRGTVRTWILSVVHNRSIDKLRQQGSRQSHDIRLDVVAETLQRPGVWPEVAANLERQRITAALTDLPVEQRRTIELAYFGGYSQSEIANQLRIPIGTVKGRLRLGMEKLRTALAEPGGFEFMTD